MTEHEAHLWLQGPGVALSATPCFYCEGQRHSMASKPPMHQLAIKQPGDPPRDTYCPPSCTSSLRCSVSGATCLLFEGLSATLSWPTCHTFSHMLSVFPAGWHFGRRTGESQTSLRIVADVSVNKPNMSFSAVLDEDDLLLLLHLLSEYLQL